MDVFGWGKPWFTSDLGSSSGPQLPQTIGIVDAIGFSKQSRDSFVVMRLEAQQFKAPMLVRPSLLLVDLCSALILRLVG